MRQRIRLQRVTVLHKVLRDVKPTLIVDARKLGKSTFDHAAIERLLDVRDRKPGGNDGIASSDSVRADDFDPGIMRRLCFPSRGLVALAQRALLLLTASGALLGPSGSRPAAKTSWIRLVEFFFNRSSSTVIRSRLAIVLADRMSIDVQYPFRDELTKRRRSACRDRIDIRALPDSCSLC